MNFKGNTLTNIILSLIFIVLVAIAYNQVSSRTTLQSESTLVLSSPSPFIQQITSQKLSQVFKLMPEDNTNDFPILRIKEHNLAKITILGHQTDILIFDENDIKNIEEYEELKSFISSGNKEDVSIYPRVNAASTRMSEIKKVELPSGTYVRFITYFTQEEGEPTLDDFSYILQGFSEGKFVHANIFNEISVEKNKDGAFTAKDDLGKIDSEIFKEIDNFFLL